MEELLIGAGFNWVLSTVKNPKKKAQFRGVILKVFVTIWSKFGNDQEFKDVVGAE